MPITRPKAHQIDFAITNITDPLVRINSGQTTANDKDIGLVLERGSDTNVALIWDESADEFVLATTTEDGSTSGDITISSYADLQIGALTVSGSILPTTTETYDIGSASLRFNDIYLAGTTINLGGTKISKDSNGNIDLLDGSNNRKIIKAAAIELYDSSGKSMKIERDATSGKMKSRRYQADGSAETDTDDVIEIKDDKSPQLGNNLDVGTYNIFSTNGTVKFADHVHIGLGQYLMFEGSATDAYQTILTVTNPTADRTFTLPDKSGTVAVTSDIPTNVSELTNDSGFITGYTVTQSDVTTHQAALSITESQISDLGSYLVSSDISGKADLASPTFTGTPLAPTAAAGTNTTQIATTAFVSTAVSNLVDSAPGTLDTLNELAAALGDDANFSTTVTNSIATKLPLAGGTLTGSVTFSGGNVNYNDNVKARFGTNGDLDIYHDGSKSVIEDIGTGNLHLRASNNLYIQTGDGLENYAVFTANGAATLYYDNSAKLATTTAGISVTGTVSATSFSGDGSGLTGVTSYTNSDVDAHLNQSNPTSGYVLSWNGSDYAWVEQTGGGGGYTASASAPSSPSDGDEWWDTDNATFYKYINDGTTSQWVEWGPGQDGVNGTDGTNGTNGTDGADAALDGTTAITGTILPANDTTYDLGSGAKRFSSVYADTFSGTASTAQYADLAEKYLADADYEPGTVLIIGGDAEVTACEKYRDKRLAGVVSTNPAYLMNNDLHGQHVVELALIGRVPCKVTGRINKGDLLTTSSIKGVATVHNSSDYVPGTIIGKALENYSGTKPGIIEILVGKV
jgi:hypothetical protein